MNQSHFNAAELLKKKKKKSKYLFLYHIQVFFPDRDHYLS